MAPALARPPPVNCSLELSFMKKEKKYPSIKSQISSELVQLVPDLSKFLTPQVTTDPVAIITAVSSGILFRKLTSFVQEYNEKKEKKEVRENSDSTEDSIQELLTILKESTSDEQKLKAAKILFFKSVHPDTLEAEQIVLFNLLQICKRLSGNEILVLKAAYELSQHQFGPKVERDGYFKANSSRYRQAWFNLVAAQLGHSIASLVEATEERLEAEKLISHREERSTPTYHPAGEFRLTDLGVKFCEYLGTSDKQIADSVED